jgi:hypothetical protein
MLDKRGEEDATGGVPKSWAMPMSLLVELTDVSTVAAGRRLNMETDGVTAERPT